MYAQVEMSKNNNTRIASNPVGKKKGSFLVSSMKGTGIHSPIGNVVIQRNIGVEIELTSGNEEKGMALEPHEKENWEKRDVLISNGTWDLTLDDTPGTQKYDGKGLKWETEEDAEEGVTIGKGPFRKYNLEFIIHGGEEKRGFGDKNLDGLKTAINEVRTFCSNGKAYPSNIGTYKNVENEEIYCHLPTKEPGSANIQLTAGTSLAGLHVFLEKCWLELTNNGKEKAENEISERVAKGNRLDPLVLGNDHQTNLVMAHVPYEKVKEVYSSGTPLIKGEEQALRAVSGMLTIVKTFLDNHEKGMAKGNIKEATPILWKTPLNLVFDSADIKEHANKIKEKWPVLIKEIFPDWYGKEIWHRPGSTLNVMKWLKELPEKDWLTIADHTYDKSFGGIGKLEGENGPSANQPILEFRSMPLNLATFEQELGKTLETLVTINKNF